MRLGKIIPRRDGGSAADKPTVISLGQVWMDVMLDVDDMPQAGDFAMTSHTKPTPGGSYRILDAASRMGVRAQHAGVIGDGVWATAIRMLLRRNGIDHIGENLDGEDSGFRLVFQDEEGRKTYIAHYGAEANGDEHTFDAINPPHGAVVHIGGNTLMNQTAAGLDAFIRRAGNDPRKRDWMLVLNSTNALNQVSDKMIEDLVLARPIWSCNRQEAGTLADRLGVYIDESSTMTVGGGFDKSMKLLCDELGNALRAPLVVRAGSRGAWVRQPGGQVEHIEGFPTKAVHTRSAGACHTGVMCAMLAKGWSLTDAVRIANAAASLAIRNSDYGVPVCPSYQETMALLEAQ